MGSFVGLVIELFRLFVHFMNFLAFASSSVMVVMFFDLVVFVFGVVFKSKSVSFCVFCLRMDELQLVLVASDFNWVMQVFLVFFLDIDWHGMIMNELHWLVRLCVFVVDMMAMFSLGCFMVFCMFARMFVNDSCQCDGEEGKKNLGEISLFIFSNFPQKLKTHRNFHHL